MKQLYYTLFIFTFLFHITGCVEDPDMDPRLQNASVPEMGKIESGEKTATSVVVKSVVMKENGAPLEKRGFKYWQVKADDETIIGAARDTFQTENIEKGEYSMTLKDLKDACLYKITSYASNEIGIGYSDTITINTNKGAGSVKTSDVKDNLVTATTARVEGIISSRGEGEITDFGFELYVGGVKDTTFTKKDGVDWGDNDSTFYYVISGLNQETEYVVKAFAQNSFGSFSQINGNKSFKTKNGRPILKDSINFTADFDFGLIGSKLLSKGESEIEEIGFCWTAVKETPNRPNIEEDDTIQCILTPEGDFEGKITTLEPDITYYAKAFAKNSFGITYSKDSIRISKKRDLPTISLNPSSTYIIENGTVTVGGEIQDEGKSPVTFIIIYYSTVKSDVSPGPTKNDGYKEATLDENNKSFSTSLKLLGGKEYFVRAYAKNASGPAVGSEEIESFTLPNVFVRMRDFSGDGRQDFMTFCLGDRAFVLGGKVGGEYTRSLYGYSSSSNNWAPLTSYISSIEGGSVCTDGNSAYIIGGKSSANITDVYSYIYNSDNYDQWVLHSNMKLRNDMVGTLNAISFAQNNSIVVIGGEKILIGDDRGLIVQDTIYHWDGSSWNDIGNFPAMIKGGVAITSGDSVIVGLGNISTDSISANCDINRELWINTSPGNWSEWRSLTKAPQGMGKVTTGVMKDSCLYFIDNKGFIWKYDLDVNKWYKCSKQSPGIADFPEYKIMKINETIYILALNNFGVSSFVTYNPTWDIANEQN